jgi:hypothetical protein
VSVVPEPAASPVLLGPQFHPCRLGTVVRHVGAYLAGDDAPEAEQRHAAAHAFRNAQADFEQFSRSVCEPHEMLSMELTIRGGGRTLHSVSTYLPSPLTLLVLCTRNCQPGDVVALRQTTAKCGATSQEARWPFGLAEAERLTRPVSTTFGDSPLER